MANQKKVIEKRPIEGSDKVLEIVVYYSKGGYDYFTYQNNPRGYYLSVTPIKETTRTGSDGVTWTSTEFSLFSGFKKFLEPATRFSAKKLAEVQAPVEDVEALVKATLEKEKPEIPPAFVAAALG